MRQPDLLAVFLSLAVTVTAGCATSALDMAPERPDPHGSHARLTPARSSQVRHHCPRRRTRHGAATHCRPTPPQR